MNPSKNRAGRRAQCALGREAAVESLVSSNSIHTSSTKTYMLKKAALVVLHAPSRRAASTVPCRLWKAISKKIFDSYTDSKGWMASCYVAACHWMMHGHSWLWDISPAIQCASLSCADLAFLWGVCFYIFGQYLNNHHANKDQLNCDQSLLQEIWIGHLWICFSGILSSTDTWWQRAARRPQHQRGDSSFYLVA